MKSKGLGNVLRPWNTIFLGKEGTTRRRLFFLLVAGVVLAYR